MLETAISYVFQTAEGGWRIADSRVSLDSVVHAYLEGKSPETIAEDFPTLSLEQIHGALAFYLRHRAEIDRYLAAQDARWEQLRKESEAAHGPLLSKLRARRGTASDPEGTACPSLMAWYGIKTWYRYVAHGRPRGLDEHYDPDLTLVEERVVVIKADSFGQAMAKAQREAEKYAESYENPYGQMVSIRCLGEWNVYQCYDEPGDGAEVYSSTERVSRKVSNLKLLESIFTDDLSLEEQQKSKKFFRKALGHVIQ